jgi:1,4-dihydroxy-2-naphthoate octaprenyltransferase
MLQRSTIQLLRFHFSAFLLPVYLFGLSQVETIHNGRAILVFIILHVLVYPSSNGYNSYMDRDTSAIGGLANPQQPTRQLFVVSVIMDALAVLISIFISPLFSLGILLYIAASRAYSYRGIRLKQYPVIGFLTVFIFQGGWIYFLTVHSCSDPVTYQVSILSCVTASLLIGALYPLTQVYQHEADRKDGVTTISYMLGKRGSFVFSAFMFLSATGSIFRLLVNRLNHFFLYLLILLPVVLFFLYWMMKVWKNEEAANFRNSLVMNVLATFCTAAFFITLIILNH